MTPFILQTMSILKKFKPNFIILEIGQIKLAMIYRIPMFILTNFLGSQMKGHLMLTLLNALRININGINQALNTDLWISKSSF